MFFNSTLPDDFPYIQASIRKPQMKKIISEVINRYDKAELRIFLDKMKSVGFKFGTKSGLTVSISDIKTPDTKKDIIKKAEQDVDKYEKLLKQDFITREEAKKARL
jgi:DNA-directed RNA polymerase subunit beta'